MKNKKSIIFVILLFVALLITGSIVFIAVTKFSNLNTNYDDSNKQLTHPNTTVVYETHNENLELLITEIDSFVNSKKFFYELYTGECIITDQGLKFFCHSRYCRKSITHIVSDERWSNIHNNLCVFPEGFIIDHIRIDSRYPDYIFFCENENSNRFLVFTRGEKPTQLIEKCLNNYELVGVNNIENNLYDINLINKK